MLDDGIRGELLLILVRQMPLVLAAVLLMVPAIFLVMQAIRAEPWQLVWLIVMGGVLAGRVAHLLVLRRVLLTQDVGRSEWQLRWGSLASGLLFGVFGWLFPIDAPEAVVFPIIVLCGLTSGSVASLTAVRGTYPVFAIPAMGPLVVRMFLTAGTFNWILGVFGCLFMVVNLGYSRNQHRALLEAILLRRDRERIVAELEEARTVADQANAAKRQLLLAAGHDIKQPLFGMRLLLDQLDAADPRRRRQYINALKASCATMTELLDKILSAAKFEMGRYTVNAQTVALGPLLEEMIAEFRSEASHRNVELRLVKTSVSIVTDRILLTQIMRNLISNALVHARSRRVLVGIRPSQSGLRIEVIDQGKGIATSPVERVFEPFFTTRSDPRTDSMGHGLGLALAQSMAGVLDGEIKVRSVLGRGTQFSLWLHSASPVRAINAGPAVDDSSETEERVRLRGKVLLIEDNRQVRAALRSALESWGLTVTVAANGESALKKLKRTDPPDLVISDLWLEGAWDGIALVRQIRDRLAGDVPALIITGDFTVVQPEDPALLILQKPVDPRILAEAIRGLQVSDAGPPHNRDEPLIRPSADVQASSKDTAIRNLP